MFVGAIPTCYCGGTVAGQGRGLRLPTHAILEAAARCAKGTRLWALQSALWI